MKLKEQLIAGLAIGLGFLIIGGVLATRAIEEHEIRTFPIDVDSGTASHAVFELDHTETDRLMCPTSDVEIIILFDSYELDNYYRHYYLGNNIVTALREGKQITVTFCHPEHGEIMIAEIK